MDPSPGERPLAPLGFFGSNVLPRSVDPPVWSADLVGNSRNSYHLKPPHPPLRPLDQWTVSGLQQKPHARSTPSSISFCKYQLCALQLLFESHKELHFGQPFRQVSHAVLRKFGHQPRHKPVLDQVERRKVARLVTSRKDVWSTCDHRYDIELNSSNQARSMDGTFDKPVVACVQNLIKVRQDRDQVSGINLCIIFYILGQAQNYYEYTNTMSLSSTIRGGLENPEET